MKHLSLLIASAPLLAVTAACSKLSEGCGKPLPTKVTAGVLGASNGPIQIESGGRERSYLIHVPKTYDENTAVPLILSFHGRTKDAAEQEGLSQFSNSTYNDNAIAVYPDGVANADGIRQWQGDPDAPTSINDIQFTSDLINHLVDRYCIDTSRIYAAGKSNGGGLVGLLSCDPGTTSQIAAFAAVSGAFYLNKTTDKLPPCNPSRLPIPILETHGLQDTTIPYAGGSDASDRGNTTSIISWIDDWVERDHLALDSNVTTTLCGEGAKTVKRYSWAETVVHYTFKNLEHDWPSTYPNDDGNLTTCIDATRFILDFFGKWTIKGNGVRYDFRNGKSI